MAVPKHKKSYKKSKQRYQFNHTKIFCVRSLVFNEFDLLYKLQKNEFAMPYYLMSTINKKPRIKFIVKS